MSCRRQALGPVSWAVASRALDDQLGTGDVHVLASFPGGLLIGVIDGLGHGPQAAEAARVAARVLEEHPSLPLIELVESSHRALRSTRGAAMTVVRLTWPDAVLSWVGVGNVEAVLLRAGAGRAGDSVVPRAGLVGLQLPPLLERTAAIQAGDTLVVATDGLTPQLVPELRARDAHRLGQVPPQELAEELLSRFTKGTDDALLLVVRYHGLAP